MEIMSKQISLSQYYPADSFIHLINPRVKILLTMLFFFEVFLVSTLQEYIIMGLFLITYIACSRVPLRMYLRNMKPLIPLILALFIMNMIFAGWGTALAVSIDQSLKMAFRLIFFALGTIVLIVTTPPFRLAYGLEDLLKPLKRLKVPARDITTVIVISLEFIPILLDEARSIFGQHKKEASRGILKRVRALGEDISKLFVNALKKTDELAADIEEWEQNRTNNEIARKDFWAGMRDMTAVGITVLMGVVLIWL